MLELKDFSGKCQDFQWTFESRLSLAEQKYFIKMQECDKSVKSSHIQNGNSKQGNGTKVIFNI
jgi:hypothetical protein